jgi:transcriptional regulator with XRE-family HTH domain
MFLMMDKFEFGQWVKDERERHGWSQSDLARESRMNRSMINKIEGGVSGSTPETLTYLANAFGYPPDFVFEKAGILPPKKELSPIKRALLHIAQDLPDSDVELALGLLEKRADYYKQNPQAKPSK